MIPSPARERPPCRTGPPRRYFPIAALLLAVSACDGTQDPGAEPAAPPEPATERFIRVEAAEQPAEVAVLRVPGRVDLPPEATYQITASIRGRVVEVHVRPGDQVQPGDPVVTLEGPEIAALRTEGRQAMLVAEAAERELARQKRLLDGGIGIEQAHDAAAVRLAEARAHQAIVDERLGFIGRGTGETGRATLLAPRAGTILALAAPAGAIVEPEGGPLAEIADLSRLRVVAEVLEKDLGLLAAGAPAEVRPAGQETPLPARITRIGAIVDPTRRRAPVYLALERAAPGLRSGTFAEVLLSHALSGASLLVPGSAVLVRDRRQVVYVRAPDGTFVPRPVRTHQMADGNRLVLEGLEPGDDVVTRGAVLLDAAARPLL